MSNSPKYRKLKGGIWFFKLRTTVIMKSPKATWTRYRHSDDKILKIEVHSGPFAGYEFVRRKRNPLIISDTIASLINIIYIEGKTTVKHKRAIKSQFKMRGWVKKHEQNIFDLLIAISKT